MADETKESQGIDWRRTFAFLEITRSFRIAIHPASLFLCFLGLAATFGLGVLLDQIPGLGGTEIHGKRFFQSVYDIATLTLWGNWAVPGIDGKTWGDCFAFLLAPVAAFWEGVTLMWAYWHTGGAATWFALVYTVLALAIWAVIGGAVTRMAAVRIAREESVPLKKAVGFALHKWPSTVTSPLIPFGVLVLLAVLVGAPTGLVLMIPYAGEWVVGVLFFLTLLVGLVLALIFVGGTFSLALQWPTIAAEGSDSFDAISRSVSYISSRPWKYIFYTLFATVYGCLTFVFVKFLTFLTLNLTHEFVGMFTWRTGGHVFDKLTCLWDVPARMYSIWPQAGALPSEASASEAGASYLFIFWVWVVLGVALAFLVSLCLTSQTVIYFLLRKAVDATDIEEVYTEESDEEDLPLEHKVEGSAPSAEQAGGTPAEAPPPPPSDTAT